MAEVKVVVKSVDQGSKQVKGFGDALKGVYDEAKLAAAGVAAEPMFGAMPCSLVRLPYA